MMIELYSLTVLTIFFMFAWLPTSVAKRITYGRSYLLSNREAQDLCPMPAWADRSLRAYENLKCYFPAYIVAVLVLAHLGITNQGTQIAALVFALARVSHFVFYTAGLVLPRAYAWGIGLVANLYLFITILVFG